MGHVESELIRTDSNSSCCSLNNAWCGFSAAGRQNATCHISITNIHESTNVTCEGYLHIFLHNMFTNDDPST